MTWGSRFNMDMKVYLDGKLVGENTSISSDYVRLKQRAAEGDLWV